MSAISSTDAVQGIRASSLVAGLWAISSGQSVEHDFLLAGSLAARAFSRARSAPALSASLTASSGSIFSQLEEPLQPGRAPRSERQSGERDSRSVPRRSFRSRRLSMTSRTL